MSHCVKNFMSKHSTTRIMIFEVIFDVTLEVTLCHKLTIGYAPVGHIGCINKRFNKCLIVADHDKSTRKR